MTTTGPNLPLDMITKADCWIHGQTHDSFDYRVQHANRSVQVVCNPWGYPVSGVTETYQNHAFNEQLLIDVQELKQENPL